MLNRILKHIQRDMRYVRRDKRSLDEFLEFYSLAEYKATIVISLVLIFAFVPATTGYSRILEKLLARFCVSIKRRTNFFLHVVVVVTAVVSRCVLTVKASTPLWFSRTRRFINVVTSCRRYCRGVSVTAEADAAFLIKRLRCQGSLHCVRI